MNSTKTQISRREFKYQIPCWDHLGQSHRRFQNSSPKAQVPRFRALAEPKVQDTEPKTQEADAKMSCGDPNSQKTAFKTQDSTPKNHSISWDGDRQIPEFKTQVPETNDSPWYVLIQNPNPRMSKGADPKLGSESVITQWMDGTFHQNNSGNRTIPGIEQFRESNPGPSQSGPAPYQLG